jgi:hypothetical protein
MGPGWFRTWAAAGVLLELQEQKIAVEELFAIELSAWIAATYISDPQPNAFHWSLQKIKPACLEPNRNPLANLIDSKMNQLDSRCVLEELHRLTTDRRLESLNIALWLGSHTGTPKSLVERPGAFEWRSEGALGEVMAASLGYEGLLEIPGQPLGVLAKNQPEQDLQPPNPKSKALLVLDFASFDERTAECRPRKQEATPLEQRYTRDLCRFSKKLSSLKGAILRPLSSGSSPSPFDSKIRNEMIYSGRLAVRNWLTENNLSKESHEGSQP